MKTYVKKTTVLAASALLCAMLLNMTSTSAQAQSATNYFTDGNGTDGTLDQYPGGTGNGWAAGWVTALGTSAAIVNGVTNTAPLNSGSNYLSWSIGGGTAASTIRRQFTNATIDVTQPYTVEFDYRLDNLTSNGLPAFPGGFSGNSDYIVFQGGVSSDIGPDVRAKCSYMVRVQGAANAAQPGLVALRWSFYDGNPASTTENLGAYYNATNVTFATNTVYHFKLQIDPYNRLYEGTVSDGVNTYNTTTAVGRKLRWRQFGPPVPFTTDFGNTTLLTFVSRNNHAARTNFQSMDSLSVIQLPADQRPARVTQVLPRRAETFYPAVSNVVLDVVTYGTNSLPSSNIVFNLNGTNFTSTNGLTLTGTDASSSRTVTYSGLVSNAIYNLTVNLTDQAGRASSSPSFFFDTFVPYSRYRTTTTTNSTNVFIEINPSNYVTVLEIENFNFDPLAAACSLTQDDNTKTDRYIQDWRYSGFTYDSQLVERTNGYFMRQGVAGIDFKVDSTANTGSNFRSCPPGINIRNETSDDFNRQEQLWTDGVTALRENVLERASTNMWFNYTHEWTNAQYMVYLRAGCILSNYTFALDKVTSDYTQTNQTTTNIGIFQLPAGLKKEILKNYLLTDTNGAPKLVTLSGKETVRLTGIAGASPTLNFCFLNYMVFLPVSTAVPVNISLTNAMANGTNFSFSFNTVASTPYTVQYNINLSTTNWTTLTNLIGDGSPVVIQDAITGSERYYRVKNP